MVDQNIQKSADMLWDAWNTNKPTTPIRELLGETDVEAAYAVQEINTKRWLEQGRRLSGRKIGLTSKAVQTQLGVDQPDYGMLFSDMDIPDGEEISFATCHQPKVEAEIAFVMGKDMDDPDVTTTEVMASIEYALPAIEVVGSRVADWNIRITDTIADNASSGLYVLGQTPVKIGDFDPRLCGMVLFNRGEPVSVGAGAACLGSPINSTLWLARVMAKAGRPLKAGDVVLSGALGPMAAVTPGEVYEARIQGLGSVRAAFSAE
ncbi:MAG: fumarylacetoacetate hydrolase family protein [Methylocystaceae bacterium]|nr:fumarylacetoacetate hydrolase family protein [Methylocystaceae bacterium]